MGIRLIMILSDKILKIKQVLNDLSPMIRGHGGDIEFVDLDESGNVHLRLLGNCIACPMSFYTVKMGIEERLKENVPNILEVIIVD